MALADGSCGIIAEQRASWRGRKKQEAFREAWLFLERYIGQSTKLGE